MVVDLRLIGTATLCAVLLSLGLLVVARDPRALVNRLFAFSMVTIIGWIGSISPRRTPTPTSFWGASASHLPRRYRSAYCGCSSLFRMFRHYALDAPFRGALSSAAPLWRSL